MKSYPLSILIPTYNRRDLVEEALHSIFKERVSKEVEVIVVDDGSIDETWAYLCSLREKYPNLKIERHAQNLGVSIARNTALTLATGSYIMFLDSDDYLVEGALETLLEKTKEEGEVYLISVWIQKGKKRKAKIFPDLPLDPFLRLKYFIEGVYADGIYLIKKTLFKNFQFNPLQRVREDWVFKGKLFALNSIEVVKEPLVVIRDHPLRLRNVPDYYESSIFLSIEELFKTLPASFQALYPFALAKAYMELGTKFMRTKEYDKAFLYFQNACKVYPSIKKEFKFLKKWLKSYLLHKIM